MPNELIEQGRDPQFYGLILAIASFLGGVLVCYSFSHGDLITASVLIAVMLMLLRSWWRSV